MGAGDLSEQPVALDVVFERFPASVRGALVVRGADADPHQARVDEAVVADLRSPNRASAEVGIAGVIVEVRPRGEVLIPLDVPFGELDPGWYAISATVLVDGHVRVRSADPSKRFLVPWPREDVRRGTVPVDATIEVPGTPGASIERLECKGDRAVVRWAARRSRADFGHLRVLADGKALPFLEQGEQEGRRSTVVYPVLKRHRSLTFELDRHVREDGAVDRGRWSVELPLP